ncbi:glycosyltransferase family 39 protein [Candidatus Fermentibacteria bacterium]|nr:glycosyltransferase family 39 protein [Candidatus Fermentibacteria bacterium]
MTYHGRRRADSRRSPNALPEVRHSKSLEFEWRRGVLVFAVALAFRGFYLAEASRQPEFNLVYMDEEYHVEWAKGLATGVWTPPYEQIKGTPYFRAPLYPYFLAGLFRLFGQSLLLLRAIQVIIGSCSCVLAYAVAARCLGGRVGLAAGLLCACSWVLTYYDAELLLPVLEVFFLLAGLLALFVSAQRMNPALAGLAGLLFGLLSITRPNALALFPFIVLWSVRALPTGRRGGFTLLLAAGFLAPPLAVTLRNRVVGGDWVVVSSQGGVNFFIGNNPESNGIEAVVPGTRHTWWGGYEDAVAIAQRDVGRPHKPSEISHYWMRRGLNFIIEEPGHWLRLTGRKVAALIGSVEIPNNEPLETRRGRYWALRFSPVTFGLLLGLFLVGLPELLHRPGSGHRSTDSSLNQRFVSLLLQVLAVYSLTIVAFFVTGRYRVPLVPLIAIGAAVTLVRIYESIVCRRRMAAALRAGAAAILIGALSVDYLGVRRGTAAYADLSDAQDLLDMGRLDDAIERLEALRARKAINVAEVHSSLARAYLKRDARGDRAAVLEVAEDGLRVNPVHPELLWYSVAGHFEARRFREAQTRLDQYLSIMPLDLRALSIGFALAMARGDTALATDFIRRSEAVESQSPSVALMRRSLGAADVPHADTAP